jgi:hypothetical protein
MSLNRVDFDTQAFEDLITQKGYRINWEVGSLCPCIDPVTNHALPDCPLCDGRGRYYGSAQQIKGIITRQNKEINIGDAMGVLPPGEAYLTTSHTNQMSLWDRITNLDSVVVNSELFFHDETGGDWLRYQPIGSVLSAFTTDSRLGPIRALIQNKDFKINPDNSISWLSDNSRPKVKQGVSFRYNHNPVWIVINNINYVRDTMVLFGNPVDTPVPMPVRVQMKLEYLIK